MSGNHYGIFDLLGNKITDSDIGDDKLAIAEMMKEIDNVVALSSMDTVSYTHLRAHET